jgi:DNA-binding LacI/PurR family transcriptional regulator
MAFTLEDVGRRCGVSRSTVSRVINDSPLVNQATKDRVLKIIKELRYAPDSSARSLTTKKTETLAVALSVIVGGVFPEILAGVDEVASQHGFHLLVVFLGGARPKSATIESIISHRRADGILAVASAVEDRELMQMTEWNVPLVCVAHKSPVPTVPSVLFDDAGGAFQATKLLLARGHRQLVHIRGPHDNFDAQERSRGFHLAMEEAGISFDASREVDGGFYREGGARVIREFLDRGVPFDGIFASNDDMAIGAIEVLVKRGIAIPEQVSVVGFDDIESAQFVGLSTVRVPSRELGRVAAQVAFDLIGGKTSLESRILPTEVIERASTQGSTVEPLKIGRLPSR